MNRPAAPRRPDCRPRARPGCPPRGRPVARRLPPARTCPRAVCGSWRDCFPAGRVRHPFGVCSVPRSRAACLLRVAGMTTIGGMVMSVAVLSDIHGVLPALAAVLDEPDVRDADRIVLTGDIAAGPMPVETLDLLRSLGDRVVWVRGNADRELVSLARGGETAIPDAIARWAAGELRPDQVDLLDRLPHPVTMEVDGFGPVLFCHGPPRDDEEVVLVDSTMRRWAEVFTGLDELVQTVVCGHTHMPYQRLVDRRLVVNPGSVGMPYGRPGPQ